MALEAMNYQQDTFTYGCQEFNFNYSMGMAGYGFGLEVLEEEKPNAENNLDINGEQYYGSINGYSWDSPPPSSVTQNIMITSSSPENFCGVAGERLFAGGVNSPVVAASRKKRRRRAKSLKNKEEMECQRMTHIAVERNRRRQMNDYLATLRSLMPPSYAQRGDQASIVGGAINFVKELEQFLQSLEAHKLTEQQRQEQATSNSNIFSDFFTFPQFSMRPITTDSPTHVDSAEIGRWSSVADIEVTMVESHANIKILSRKRPKQLLKMVAGFQSIYLNILHLNITTVDQSVLYSFSVKAEDECQLSTVNEIATAVHDMVGMIQDEYMVGRDNPPPNQSESI